MANPEIKEKKEMTIFSLRKFFLLTSLLFMQ